MSRSTELAALVTSGAIGAGLAVVAVGASAAFLLPAILGVGLVAAAATSRRATPYAASRDEPRYAPPEVDDGLATQAE